MRVDRQHCWLMTKGGKNNAICCVFLQQKGTSLLSQSHLVIRCLAYLPKLTKETSMTSRPLHTSKDCAGERYFRFQRSRNFHKRLTCLKELRRPDVSVLTPIVRFVVSQGILKITCRFSWLANHRITVESKSPADLNEEGHQFCSVRLKGSSGRYGCQNESLFHSQINGIWPPSFEVSLSIKSCSAVSAVGWLSKLDKSKGPYFSSSVISVAVLYLTPILLIHVTVFFFNYCNQAV